MTVREYIQEKLKSLNLQESDMMDIAIASNVSLDDEYNAQTSEATNIAMIGGIESILFSPRLKSVNEGGFSMSWDYSELGKYYLWLCRRYGRTPDDDTLTMLGISVIKDISNIW